MLKSLCFAALVIGLGTTLQAQQDTPDAGRQQRSQTQRDGQQDRDQQDRGLQDRGQRDRAPGDRANRGQQQFGQVGQAGQGQQQTDALWSQLHQLHQQIVNAEVAKAKQNGASGATPGSRGRDTDTAERPGAALTPDPSGTANVRGEGMDPMMKQFAQLHQQIVAAKVAQLQSSSGAASDSSRQPGANPGANPGATPGANREGSATAQGGNDAQWQQFVALHKQIIDRAVEKAMGDEQTLLKPSFGGQNEQGDRPDAGQEPRRGRQDSLKGKRLQDGQNRPGAQPDSGDSDNR